MRQALGMAAWPSLGITRLEAETAPRVSPVARIADRCIPVPATLRKLQAAEKPAAGATYEASGFVIADELGAAPSPRMAV